MGGRLLLAGSVAVALAAMSGCTETVPSGGDIDVAGASRVKGFDAFWLGRSFGGYRLTQATSGSGGGGPAYVLYGTCKIEVKPFGEGGCSLPVQMISQNVCDEFWAKFSPGDRPRLHSLRGAKFGFNQFNASQAYVYTGHTTITIFAPRRLIGRALRTIRPIKGPAGASRLAAPARGSLTRQLPCQQKLH